MTEMAKMQLDEAKERLPELEEEIKFMLIPKDQKTLKCDDGIRRYRWG
jgi:peptide chain release factor 1